MKIIASLILSCLIILNAVAQQLKEKPPIDSSVYKSWPSVEGDKISNNGKYASYHIDELLTNRSKLVITTTDGRWKKELQQVNNFMFSADSRYAIYNSKDTLCILTLGTSKIEYITNLKSSRLTNDNTTLIYQLKGDDSELFVRNFLTNQRLRFSKVNLYYLGNTGKSLLLITKNGLSATISWVDLQSGKVLVIGNGSSIDGVVFDATDAQTVFLEKDTISKKTSEVWYYKKGNEKAELLLDRKTIKTECHFRLDGMPEFSRDGKKLIFYLENQMEHPGKVINNVSLHIWNYKDSKFPSNQLSKNGRENCVILNLENRKLFTVCKTNELAVQLNAPYKWNNDWAIIEERLEGANTILKRTFYLVSQNNGSRIRIPVDGIANLSLSPSGELVVYYDYKNKGYFTYDIKSGIIQCITTEIITDWRKNRNQFVLSEQLTRGIAGWLSNNHILLYDYYDIWKVDLRGIESPVNLTNGYGRENNIIFSLAFDGDNKRIIEPAESLLLTAFNPISKDNGFFRKSLSQKGNPHFLTMGSYVYCSNDIVRTDKGRPPLKAKDVNIYLVRRMTSTESSNVFSTEDFKKFTLLSNCFPERKYNWLTKELHTWKALDGNLLQGVLFKPENFDPNKRYPVIFYCYEQLSDGLNEFNKPIPSDGRLNIPWYVSNGYLVFTPDIKFTIGHTGESAVNSVVSAAQYLSKFSFVNKAKMGLQGVSFGGFLANYIMTHTDIFAAASTSAGASDFISYYGDLHSSKLSQQFQFESGQYRIGASLLERPDLYIENSPVLKADKVTCPVLLFHVTNDITVPFGQAVELFTGLKRAGKKAWMLQYDEGSHGVWGDSALDFDMRMQQFFNHYLKDAPPPKWMTEKEAEKTIKNDSKIELDYSGVKP
jgi:dipeptidyl aminopeptidase/acylaminoacyl peptidase